MSRHVAFLRGVNLGAKRKASGADLVRAFEAAGFEDVATFRNSGNVVFAAAGGEEQELVEAAEGALRETLGFDVRVVLRSARQVRAIAAHEPFEQDVVAATEGRLQVILMAAKPRAATRKRVLALATERDRLALRGRELYWLPAGRMSDSDFDPESLSATLDPTTVRTKATIEGIAAKFLAG